MWYIYTVVYYSSIKRNVFDSFLIRWMNLEPIIQNIVSQKEKNKYFILKHIYRIQKDGTDESICKAAMEMQTQQTDFWPWRRRRRDELREQQRNISITICKIRQPVEICCMTEGAQIWCSVTKVGGRFKREVHTYTHG